MSASAHPRKVIRITVVHAEGLSRRDVFRLPDPFAVVTVDAEQTHTTSAIKKTLNPYWNESFDVTAKDSSVVAVQVFDQRKFKRRDQGFLGVVNVRVSDVLNLDPGGHVRLTLDLKKSNDNIVVRGKVIIHLSTNVSQPISNPGTSRVQGVTTAPADMGMNESSSSLSLNGVGPTDEDQSSSQSNRPVISGGAGADSAAQQANAKEDKDSLNQTINSLRTDLRVVAEGSNSKLAHLEKTVEDQRHELATSRRAASLKEDNFNKIIESLEKTVTQLRTQLAESRQKIEERDNLIQILRAHEQKHNCEALYAVGRTFDAALSLIEITNTMNEEMRANKLLVDWLTEFTNRCAPILEKIGDDASNVEEHDKALATYSTILSFGPSSSNNVLIKWASTVITLDSTSEALRTATKFKLPRFMIYRAICDVLERDGRITEAITRFRQMQSELAEDTCVCDERAQWELSFQRRCAEKLEKLASVAMDSQNYDKAAEHLSIILSLDRPDRLNILIKRSKARASMNSWGDALSDADEAIKLDPSFHQGYERRHAALHGARRHAEAVEAFDTMLLKLDESPHEDIRKLRSQYIDARPTIRRIVNQTLRHMPRILIDTTTGRLHDKTEQVAEFEALPIWSDLVSSMVTELDNARIWSAVKEFYRYVMLSHTWEHDEPLLQKIKDISVHDLKSSPTNIKLQKFCTLVHSLGFRWAWADTTCVDQENNVLLQESLVAMFTWYRGSSLTLVYLRGVLSEPQLPGGLRGSIWNTRGWTYQEYVAAEIVQFYTEDWKPYLGLDLANHKESPAIISEMQEATGVSAREMAVFRPGLDRVREKLYVASMRQTTRVEDTAYSLLGIFNIAIPVIYGEGDRAVGRLLEHILTGSGDVTILAWTGHAGSYNSCLPVDLTVYNQRVPPHIPRPIEIVEMDNMVIALRSLFPNPSLAVMLHNQLRALPSPSIASTRLRLAGIICPVTELVRTSHPDPLTTLRVYHATTTLFGDIEIKTTDELTETEDLTLIHPWIRPLLDQEFSRRADALDKTTQALRFITCLRQPFGALLLEQVSPVEYKRVAADSLIMVQLCEEVSLTDLMDNISTVEIQ